MTLDYITVGPSKTGVGAKIKVADGPSRITLDGPRAAARFMLAREVAGMKYDRFVKELLFELDEAANRPWPITGEEFLRLTRLASLDIRYDAKAEAELQQLLRRTQARYSRWLPPQQGEMQWTYDPGSIDQGEMRQVDETLRHLGWDREIFPFMYQGLLEMGTKRDVLIAAGMGLSKTRTSLALADYHRHTQGLTGPVIILGAKRHLFPTWPDELAKTDLIRVLYGDSPYEQLVTAKDRPTYTKPFLLVSLERLTRLDEAQMSELVAAARNAVVIVDEIYLFANARAQRSEALNMLSARNHIGLSGTPLTGFVGSILSPIQWLFRGGSCALPDYPGNREGSARKFEARHVTFAQSEDGRSRKRVPYVKNEELFHDMIAPLFYRRLRGEPEVVEALGTLMLEEEFIDVRLDDDHVEFYLACVKEFSAWYARELDRRRRAGEKATIPPNELLVKLGFLIRAVSAPWRMRNPVNESTPAELSDGFHWPEYERKPTAIMRAAIERAVTEVEEGYQVIIFGETRDPLDLMHAELIRLGVPAVVMHGGIPSVKRLELIEQFRRGDAKILVASYGTGAEGLNLACASRVILTEYVWNPSKVRQAVARITRPDQKYTPLAIHLRAPGTIQQYVLDWSMLKQKAIDTALDRLSQADSDDIPDVNQFARSLVGYVEDDDQVQPRTFELDLDDEDQAS